MTLDSMKNKHNECPESKHRCEKRFKKFKHV